MAKVYCKDCRYSKMKYKRACCMPDIIAIRSKNGYKQEFGLRFKQIKNANNDCEDFKRKWWKIFNCIFDNLNQRKDIKNE